jgi:hypothetical protein
MMNEELDPAISRGSAATSSSNRSDLSVPGVLAASADSETDDEKVEGEEKPVVAVEKYAMAPQKIRE